MASASTLPNLYQGVDKDSFGYKLIAKFGWKEGQGLGANKQGITEHLKVKKKQDALGVGAAEHVHKLRDWTTGMVGYDAILTGLKEITRGGPNSSTDNDSSSTDNDSSSSEGRSSGYDSDSDTSGGAGKVQQKKQGSKTAGRKAHKQQEDKKQADKAGKQKKRAAGGHSDEAPAPKKSKVGAVAAATSDTSSDSSDSDSGSEAGAAASLAVPAKVTRVKAASHVGRYQKREKAKTVRNYSAQDLAAILGLPGSAPLVANGEGAAGWAAAAAVSNTAAARGGSAAAASSSSDSGDSSSSDDSDDSSDGEQNGDQQLCPNTPPGSDTPPSRVQQQGSDDKTLSAADRGERLVPVDDADEDAGGSTWWRSVFLRAGRTGGAGPAAATTGKQRINISGFQEQDQTNLYMQAHEGASKGKQGLGRSSMPKKVAGTRWAGKKTKLGSDSEDDEQEEEGQQQQQGDSLAAAAAAAGREVHTKHGIVIVLPVKRQQPEQQEVEVKEKAADESDRKKQHKDKSKGKGKQQQDEAGSSKFKKRKQQVGAAAAVAPSSSCKKGKKAKQQQQQERAVIPAEAADHQQQKPNVKWAKLAAKILEGAPKKRMRVQKLHKKIVSAAGYDVDAPGVDTEALFQQMLKKLRKAEGLAVCDKYVGLAV